jgi:hypothetical protein
VVTDATANANNGQFVGSVLTLDGIDDYVYTPDLYPFFYANSNGTVTLEIRFRANGPGVIVGETAGNLFNGMAHNSQIEIRPDGSVYADLYGPGPIKLGNATFGEWHHAVLRFNGNGLLLEGFLDGMKSGNVYGGYPHYWPWQYGIGSGLRYTVGAPAYYNSGGFLQWFNGAVAEFRVWNIARSDADIINYQAIPLQGNEPGLVGYWKLDTVQGMTTRLSGNYLDGSIYNEPPIPTAFRSRALRYPTAITTMFS